MPKSKAEEPERMTVDELMRSQDPLPPYDQDPDFTDSMKRKRIGELIAGAMNTSRSGDDEAGT